MLDKLRRKFILIIMALVTAALAIMAGVILYINYQQLSHDVVQAVEYATTARAFVEHGPDGSNPMPATRSATGAAGEESPQTVDDVGAGDLSGGVDGNWRGDDNGSRRTERAASANMVATSVYYVESDGTVTQTLMDALELQDDELNTALSGVLAARSSAERIDGCMTGHLLDGDLYYGVRETMYGTKVAFASGSYITNSIWNLGMVLAAVCACVWVAFLIISVLLARWVVRPTERAWSQQQQFVADASHELKTPLAVMMANNSILLSNGDQTVDSQRRWVESNQVEARQMLELVNDMLFLARPANAERQTVRDTVDFSALVQRNTLQFEAVCFERGIALEDEVEAGISVLGDANRLQRLASTLIDNACKYADAHVSVKLRKTGGQAQLAISNDGAVIPAEDLPHVFDRFYRVDKARVRSEGGVGLGLAIAQEVAHQHGGAITVTSSEAAGTTFTATLPCAG